ncbi:Serine protease nudel [Acromyrmex echinatior]|uniref:limulus clotting factor C n=2 Tax=Acromyrmex echinatior TaxID=103372 RepID=F4X8T9_ACREC|nr:Serine protease nudel [Acromyrmex echinatior]
MTKSSGRSHSNFYARHKHILLIGAISILLIVLFITIINFMFSIMSGHDAHNTSVRIQPEIRVERVIRLGFPLSRRSLLKSRVGKVIDGDPSFSDQTELTSQITQVVKDDTFLTINGRDADTRFKREVSRKRRDCALNDQYCKVLLHTVQDYLVNLNNKFSATNDEKSLPRDILKCLECKQISIANENYTSRLKDRYFPHDYTEQNRSSDFSTTIKLLDDREAENGSKLPEVNQIKAADIQLLETDSVIDDPLQNATNQSLKDVISETSTVSINYTNSNGSQRIYVNDTDSNNSDVNVKWSDRNSVVNNSPVMKSQNNEGISAVSKNDQQQSIITANEGVTSVKPLFLMESSTRMHHDTVTKDDGKSMKTTIAADSIGTTETRIRTIIDLTKQITENVTSVPVVYDVTGINGNTVHPSAHPSFEGHPENRSTTATNGSRLKENHRDNKHFMPADHFQIKDNGKPMPVAVKTTKSFQQLQLTPTTWTMPHPICFFGYPGQFSNMPLSPESAFYSSPSSTQHRGFPFQNPLHQGFSPNYMQIQANTPMSRLNYADSLPQSIAQAIGPTGPAMPNAPIFSLNQQSTAMSQQPIANMPYFCGYMSLSTVHFPPISDTSQSDRSVGEVKDLPKESQKLPHKVGVITQHNPQYHTLNKCPINYHQCDNQYCIPRIKWCDGRVDCADASDETRCSCRDRISRNRLCDGYFDCPHGEDELGCFGCPMESFNCDDWDKRYNSNNCVLLSQRCDGIKHCPNGKDELDCNMLLEHMGSNDIFAVGYTQGYLHKNVRGQWYPVCSETLSWAVDACESEIGLPLTTMPEIQTVRMSEIFQNLYVIESDNNDIKMTLCPGTAVFVKCPPLPCGTKVFPRQNLSPAFNTTKNNYMSRRYMEEQSPLKNAEFNKLYQETLRLLKPNQFMSEKKMQKQINDTFVGSQLRVVGGRTSQPRAWPFLVAIYKDGFFHCGGVILSEVYILTAGHCMDRYEGHYYEIQAGILRRLSFSPMAQWRKVKYVMVHPNYVKEEMQNDIAVIMLDESLLFNRWVRQVCLPTLNTAGAEWKASPSPQSICIAIGWGSMRENGPDPDHLREVEVPILSSCKHSADQNNATICAGYPAGGHDACQGDSGGPLMCRNLNLESQWYAAGLISHGDGCGRPDEPGVYMKVSYYVDWILQTFKILDNQMASLYENKPLDSCIGFSCHSSIKKCLPIKNHCDGIVNCLDAEDEIECQILKANYARYGNSNDNFPTFIKSQAKEVSSDTTEKNEVNTEATPISTSSYFFYQTETQTYNNENSNIVDIYETTPEITMSNVRSTFTCTNLIQTIKINKRCDKHLDCEDGTDEKDCTCRDYLLNFQPTAICDGHLDCDDETDEKDCGICKNNEFYCSRSGDCISITKRCDGNFDCSLNEDELDCIALTNGEYVNVDSDNWSILNTEGLLSRYYNGTWHVECLQADMLENSTKTSIIGENLCKYLGFTGLQSLDKAVVNKTILETKFSRKWDNTTGDKPLPQHVAESKGGETCTTLRFRCRPVLSSSADSHVVIDPRTGNHTYLWPWLAAIFVDGRYHCSALLLEPNWLLSSSSCTEIIRLSVNYTTALLGQSHSFLYVDGPHQQISIVDEIRDVERTNVSLLHLKTAVNFTRYVQPLFLEKKIYPPAKSDLCVAIGTDNEYVTQSIFLQPILQNCDKCYRCFVEALGTKCSTNGTSSNWNGTVFCRSEKGWYPVAVFQENDGPCSFRSMRNLTSIDYIHAYLTQTLEKVSQPTPEAACDGVRCNIGQCIPWNQVCDGVMDCRDGADEKNAMCLQVQQIRRRNETNKCAKSEIQCRNGECISKSAFCDGKVDCSNGVDEPVICSCAEYLKLTMPERLCDGVRHCLDKTDESPEECQCTITSFKCNTESKNHTCISQDFVCDGDNDCPNGEDEMDCRGVQQLSDDRPAAGEVMQRSYGVWHTLCYPSEITSHEEAVKVCRKNGYTNGIIDYKYQSFNQPAVPSRDDFYMIRLNSDTWITMRNDKPLITLVPPEKPCYRLFIKCSN